MQGSDPKQQRIAERQQPLQRSQDEQTPATRMTRRGETMTATSCEDEQEAETERILLEPTVYCTEELDKKKTIKGTKHEIEHLLSSGVYSEVNINDLRPEQQATIIESRLVLRNEEDKIRARIEDKGCTEQIEDADTTYASTPIFCILRILLTLAMAAMIHPVRNIKAGDTSVAFLQTLAAISKLVQKAMRKERQNLAQILQDLDKRRLKSEPNVHMKKDGTACILVHKDDLLFIEEDKTVNELFTTIQSPHEPGQTMPPQGRGITNKGDHEISLSKDYTTTMLEEAGMTTYETATTPGTAANKASNDDNENIPVNKEEHALYRTVGKLQRMTHTHTRPDLSFVTRELATANIRRIEKSEAHTELPTSFKGLQVHSTSENNTRKQQGSRQRSQEEQQFKKSTRRRAQEALHIRNFLTETITHEQATKNTSTRIPPVPKASQQESGQCAEILYNKRYTLASAQNQHARQPCRHIHNVCHSRSLQQTPLQIWAFELKQQLTFSSTVSQASFTSMLTSTPTKAPAAAR